jgi:hypothetical protein
MCDRALRVEAGYIVKRGFRVSVGEGVKERYATIELFLNCRFTGDGEGYVSEFLRRRVVVLLCDGQG